MVKPSATVPFMVTLIGSAVPAIRAPVTLTVLFFIWSEDSSAETASEVRNFLSVLEPPLVQAHLLASFMTSSLPPLAKALISPLDRTVPLTSTVPLSAVMV